MRSVLTLVAVVGVLAMSAGAVDAPPTMAARASATMGSASLQHLLPVRGIAGSIMHILSDDPLCGAWFRVVTLEWGY